MSRMTFLGDMMITKDQLDTYRTEDNAFDFDYPLHNLKKILADSDYVVANLETPCDDNQPYTNEVYSFNTPSEIIRALKNLGVDMVQTANNHCLDRGIAGLEATMKAIKSKGMKYIGTHEKNENMYHIFEWGGVKIAVLAATYGTNAFLNNVWLNDEEAYLVDMTQEQELYRWYERLLFLNSRNIILKLIRKIVRIIIPSIFLTPIYERREPSTEKEKRLLSEIQKCKIDLKNDFVIVLLHIGGQYNSEPTDYTLEMISKCKSSGADIVIANHEHVIHSFKYERDSSDHAFFSCFSLGNTLSSTGVTSEPMDQMAQYSVVWHIDFDKNRDFACSFQILINHKDDKGRVVVSPFYDLYYDKDNEERKTLFNEAQILLNRLYGTRNEIYKIKEIYNVE